MPKHFASVFAQFEFAKLSICFIVDSTQINHHAKSQQPHVILPVEHSARDRVPTRLLRSLQQVCVWRANSSGNCLIDTLNTMICQMTRRAVSRKASSARDQANARRHSQRSVRRERWLQRENVTLKTCVEPNCDCSKSTL